MALVGKARLLQAEASRTVIYLSQRVVRDSQFPFKPGDGLVVKVDPKARTLTITLDEEEAAGAKGDGKDGAKAAGSSRKK